MNKEVRSRTWILIALVVVLIIVIAYVKFQDQIGFSPLFQAGSDDSAATGGNLRGESCKNNVDCASGMCGGYVLSPVGERYKVCSNSPLGAGCGSNGECESGVCSLPVGVCDPGRKGEGEKCTNSHECRSGFACIRNPFGDPFRELVGECRETKMAVH